MSEGHGYTLVIINKFSKIRQLKLFGYYLSYLLDLQNTFIVYKNTQEIKHLPLQKGFYLVGLLSIEITHFFRYKFIRGSDE